MGTANNTEWDGPALIKRQNKEYKHDGDGKDSGTYLTRLDLFAAHTGKLVAVSCLAIPGPPLRARAWMACPLLSPAWAYR